MDDIIIVATKFKTSLFIYIFFISALNASHSHSASDMHISWYANSVGKYQVCILQFSLFYIQLRITGSVLFQGSVLNVFLQVRFYIVEQASRNGSTPLLLRVSCKRKKHQHKHKGNWSCEWGIHFLFRRSAHLTRWQRTPHKMAAHIFSLSNYMTDQVSKLCWCRKNENTFTALCGADWNID